jgi:hypothetical protein
MELVCPRYKSTGGGREARYETALSPLQEHRRGRKGEICRLSFARPAHKSYENVLDFLFRGRMREGASPSEKSLCAPKF